VIIHYSHIQELLGDPAPVQINLQEVNHYGGCLSASAWLGGLLSLRFFPRGGSFGIYLDGGDDGLMAVARWAGLHWSHLSHRDNSGGGLWAVWPAPLGLGGHQRWWTSI